MEKEHWAKKGMGGVLLDRQLEEKPEVNCMNSQLICRNESIPKYLSVECIFSNSFVQVKICP